MFCASSWLRLVALSKFHAKVPCLWRSVSSCRSRIVFQLDPYGGCSHVSCVLLFLQIASNGLPLNCLPENFQFHKSLHWSCKDGGQCKPLQQARLIRKLCFVVFHDPTIWALHGRGFLCMGSLNALDILRHFLNPFTPKFCSYTSFLWRIHFPVWFSVCKAAPMQCQNFSMPPQPLASFSICWKRFRAGWVNVMTVPILCCEFYIWNIEFHVCVYVTLTGPFVICRRDA